MREENFDHQSSIAEIRARLQAARRAWRLAEALGVLLKGAAILLALVLSAVIADNLLALSHMARMVVAGGLILATITVLLIPLARSLLRPITDEMVAVHIERGRQGIDNRIINTVLLQRERFDDPITQRMAAAQAEETADVVRRCDAAAPADRAALRRWGRWTTALALLTAVYGVFFADRFANAMQRYAAPHRFIPAITQTQLTVLPGNATLLQGEPIDIEARVEGVLPEKAFLVFDDGQSGAVRQPMAFEGSHFAWRFASVQRRIAYHVVAGDARSDTFTLDVRTRPSLKEIAVTTVYPEYMALSERTERGIHGNVSAPTGARVRIEATADRPIAQGWLDIRSLSENAAEEDTRRVELTCASECVVRGESEMSRSGMYSLSVTDAAGIANQPLLSQWVALPDEPPAVRLVSPTKDLALPPGAKAELLAEARDDFSIRRMALLIQFGPEVPWQTHREWPYSEARPERKEGCVLDLAALGLQPGSVLSYCFQAFDGHPAREETAGRSRVYQITVVSEAAALEQEKALLEAFRARVQRLIAMQRENLHATERLGAWGIAEGDIAADNAARDRFNALAQRIAKAQEAIYIEARETAARFAALEAAERIQVLRSIIAREMASAFDQINIIADVTANGAIAPAAAPAAETERQIIALLDRLLTDPQALAAERLQQEAAKEKVADAPENLNPERPRVERLREALAKFQDEQREAIALSKQLAEKDVNDFTKADEEALQKVIDTEQKWAKFFQEAATDLSKLPPQDFSLANMSKEFLEVYNDIKKAADAAELKKIEMAVPLEQSGAELAEKIETNLEKWLAEKPDNLQWKMEDPVQDYDVPLAELPDELEDMIGELLDEENDLLASAEDATSGWLGSMDKGAGWTAMDGPISNMSAKGVTGNLLPNQQEVGGRSGEGRTGKSSGQFVEESAQGKGGRETPSRMTTDPFEAGTVKDTSAEPGSGSTGGGKASGFGQEGYQGPLPLNTQQELKRMAHMQQQLIDKAQRIDHGLSQYNYPRGELPKTIELMKEVQRNMERGTVLSTAGASHKVILSNLREVKDVVARQKQVHRDSGALLPEDIRREIASHREKDVPPQYKDLVESYFRAIAESGSARPVEK